MSQSSRLHPSNQRVADDQDQKSACEAEVQSFSISASDHNAQTQKRMHSKGVFDDSKLEPFGAVIDQEREGARKAEVAEVQSPSSISASDHNALSARKEDKLASVTAFPASSNVKDLCFGCEQEPGIWHKIAEKFLCKDCARKHTTTFKDKDIPKTQKTNPKAAPSDFTILEPILKAYIKVFHGSEVATSVLRQCPRCHKIRHQESGHEHELNSEPLDDQISRSWVPSGSIGEVLRNLTNNETDLTREKLFAFLCRANLSLIVEAVLLDHCDQKQLIKKTNALDFAILSGCNETVDVLLQYTPYLKDKWTMSTMLHHAARTGNFVLTDRLLVARWNVNDRNALGCTPLFNAVEKKCIRLVEIFLDEGANINATDNEGKTALDYARRLGYYDIARVLEARSPHPP